MMNLLIATSIQCTQLPSFEWSFYQNSTCCCGITFYLDLCLLVDEIFLTFLQIKYSVMHPGTHVWPHTGPTNCRLRLHLGLVIPNNVAIRVGRETK